MMIERIVGRRPENVQFTWISDAEQAYLHLLGDEHPNYFLILLDIKMPRLTGIELLEKLDRAKKLSAGQNIVVLSSSSLQRDIDEVTRYEEVRFKTKPSGYLDTKEWLNELISQLLLLSKNK